MDISEAVIALREAVPEFEPVYAFQIKKWLHYPGGLSGSQVVYDFGDEFLKERLSTDSADGPIDEAVQRVLDTLERFLDRGDDLVVDAVYFGIVDTFARQPDKLRKYALGPLTEHEFRRAGLPRHVLNPRGEPNADGARTAGP